MDNLLNNFGIKLGPSIVNPESNQPRDVAGYYAQQAQQQAQNQQNPFSQFGDWASGQAANLGNQILGVPAAITQAFGIKSPFDVFSNNINTGTDFAVPEGTPVGVPTGRWRVVSAFNQANRPGFIGDNTNNGYGNSIMVQNMDSGERLRFSHLSKVGVKPGDIVGGGVVGLSGRTGNVTGPHLDLEYYDSKGKLGDVTKSPFMQQKMLALGHDIRPQPKGASTPKSSGNSGTPKQIAEYGPQQEPNPYLQNANLFTGYTQLPNTQPSLTAYPNGNPPG